MMVPTVLLKYKMMVLTMLLKYKDDGTQQCSFNIKTIIQDNAA